MMLAGFLPEAGRVEVGEFPTPEPSDGQVLVRMRWASICGSDVHVVFHGFARPEALGRPGYPGHEGVGEVVASRSPGFPIGTPVLTTPPGPIAGCFAQYQVLDGRYCVPLPPDGARDRLLLAQQLGTTIFALRKFWREPTAGVATVIGAGSAGLFFLQLLRQAGFTTVVSDLEPSRLEIARRLGADRTVHAPDESVVAATLDVTGGLGADLVVEAAGYDACREHAVQAIRKQGRVGFFGFPERPGLAPFPFELAFRRAASIEFVIDTQLEPGLRSFRAAVDAIDTGRIDVDHCLAPRVPLEQLPDALAQARDRRAVKLTIDLA